MGFNLQQQQQQENNNNLDNNTLQQLLEKYDLKEISLKDYSQAYINTIQNSLRIGNCDALSDILQESLLAPIFRASESMESEDHRPIIDALALLADSLILLEKSETYRGMFGNLLQSEISALLYLIAVSPRDSDPKTPILERTKNVHKNLQLAGLVDAIPKVIYTKNNESPALKQLRGLWHNLKRQYQTLVTSNLQNLSKNQIKEMSMRDVWNCLGTRQPTSPNPSRMAFQKLLDREVQNVFDEVNEYLSKPNWFSLSNLQQLHTNLVLEAGIERGTFRQDVTVGSYLFYTTYRTFLPPEEIETGISIVNSIVNSEEAITNPILRAYYAYASLIFFIHPFEDGNGRTGRLISNMFLIEGGFPSTLASQDKTLTFDEFFKKVVDACN